MGVDPEDLSKVAILGIVQNEYMNNKGVLDIDQGFVGCHIDIQQ